MPAWACPRLPARGRGVGENAVLAWGGRGAHDCAQQAAWAHHGGGENVGWALGCPQRELRGRGVGGNAARALAVHGAHGCAQQTVWGQSTPEPPYPCSKGGLFCVRAGSGSSGDPP